MNIHVNPLSRAPRVKLGSGGEVVYRRPGIWKEFSARYSSGVRSTTVTRAPSLGLPQSHKIQSGPEPDAHFSRGDQRTSQHKRGYRVKSRRFSRIRRIRTGIDRSVMVNVPKPVPVEQHSEASPWMRSSFGRSIRATPATA